MHPYEVLSILLPAFLACREDDSFDEVASGSEDRHDRGGVRFGAVRRDLDYLALQVGD